MTEDQSEMLQSMRMTTSVLKETPLQANSTETDTNVHTSSILTPVESNNNNNIFK